MAWAKAKPKARVAPTADEGEPLLEATRPKEEEGGAASSTPAEVAGQTPTSEAKQLEAQDTYAAEEQLKQDDEAE
eukprot:1655060-Lingulodinium_polyedra.AAC.1